MLAGGALAAPVALSVLPARVLHTMPLQKINYDLGEEIACLRNAGRRASYRDTTLYTTLSPCPMCSGAILLFQIPRVIVGEAESFAGDLGFLTERGVDVVLLDDCGCVAVMQEFQRRYPDVWSEDIGGR